ncbi:putative coiled-coil protein SlyX [Bradyrhizobium sp. USDA 4472]
MLRTLRRLLRRAAALDHRLLSRQREPPKHIEMNRAGKAVTDQSQASELPPVLQRPSKGFRWSFALVAVLLVFGAGGAYYWTDIETFAEAPPAHGIVAPTRDLSPEDKDVLLGIQSGQQKTADEIVELNRNLDAQQAELKRISGQIEALTQRIHELQKPAPVVSPAPAASPPPVRTTSKPAKRDVRPSKPQGAVSVGGAPLTAEPSTE